VAIIAVGSLHLAEFRRWCSRWDFVPRKPMPRAAIGLHIRLIRLRFTAATVELQVAIVSATHRPWKTSMHRASYLFRDRAMARTAAVHHTIPHRPGLPMCIPNLKNSLFSLMAI
jgi:hypothetical protein